MNTPKYSLLLLCLVASVSVLSFVGTGCGDEGPAPQGSLPPKVGSTWTFDRWFLDSNQQAQDQAALVAIVRETDVSYEGESGLLHIEEVLDGGDPLPIWLRYESNGDVRLLHPSFYPIFLTLPTGSMADSTPLPAYDTSYTEFGTYFALHYVGAIRYAGLEEIEVDGEHLTTHHIVLTIAATATVGSNTTDQTSRVDLWYVPSIGYFAKSEVWIQEPPLFGMSLNRGDRRELKNWSLKP